MPYDVFTIQSGSREGECIVDYHMPVLHVDYERADTCIEHPGLGQVEITAQLDGMLATFTFKSPFLTSSIVSRVANTTPSTFIFADEELQIGRVTSKIRHCLFEIRSSLEPTIQR